MTLALTHANSTNPRVLLMAAVEAIRHILENEVEELELTGWIVVTILIGCMTMTLINTMDLQICMQVSFRTLPYINMS
jgi:hypothetical protein